MASLKGFKVYFRIKCLSLFIITCTLCLKEESLVVKLFAPSRILHR